MAALLVLASGFSILLSALNVKLRDMRHLIEVAMQLWFWLTPIVYPYEKLAPHLRGLSWLYLMNPMTPIVLTFQRVLYPHVRGVHELPAEPPEDPAGAADLVDRDLRGARRADPGRGIALFVFAVWVFGRLEGNFAEEL